MCTTEPPAKSRAPRCARQAPGYLTLCAIGAYTSSDHFPINHNMAVNFIPVNITDAVSVLSYLFSGGVEPACEAAGDGNDDGRLDISDALAILGYLFLGSAAPPAPGPDVCGSDPTEDELVRCEDPREVCADG